MEVTEAQKLIDELVDKIHDLLLKFSEKVKLPVTNGEFRTDYDYEKEKKVWESTVHLDVKLT